MPALTLALLVATSTATVLDTAEVKVDGKRAFHLERARYTDADGATHLTSTFRDLQGQVALHMDARMAGDVPRDVVVEQRQSGERARVELRAGQVRFELSGADGRRETAESEALGLVFVGPGLAPWMTSDGPWRRLDAGEAVEFKVAAWDRQAVYGFRLRPLPESTAAQLVVRMEPTNLLFRPFAGDMRYTFERRTRRHLRYSGMTSLKRRDADGDLEDVAAEMDFRAP